MIRSLSRGWLAGLFTLAIIWARSQSAAPPKPDPGTQTPAAVSQAAGATQSPPPQTGTSPEGQTKADKKAKADQAKADRKAKADQAKADKKAKADQAKADRKAKADQAKADKKAREEAKADKKTEKRDQRETQAAQRRDQANQRRTQAAQQRTQRKAQLRTEHLIEGRDYVSKGIEVGAPKVYDDSLLQQMLITAQAKLTALQGFDQTSLTNRLGAITGANQQFSSLALSVQTPSLPGVSTTSNGGTNSTVTTLQPGATSPTLQNTVNQPVTNVTTTVPQMTPPNPAPAAPATSLPTSSPQASASDLLNEQLQLTYEIANLRLMLEGSLNDRAFRKDGFTIPKPRSTVGIPITISAPMKYKNAVAVVEVEVETVGGTDSFESDKPPALLSVLPREKTYNVAAITDHSAQIGGGFVTQVVGSGGSLLTGRRTYYVVQDQDTVSLTFQPENHAHVGFLWQFRPVLGQPYVKTGLKQTFVQLAFAAAPDKNPMGRLYATTYWRTYDRRTGQVGEVIPGSLHKLDCALIANFDLKPHPDINTHSLEDLGGGNLAVTIKGPFTTQTGVRIGGTVMQDGAAGFQSTYQGLRFVASIADLATKKVAVVGRDGSETEPLIDLTQADGSAPPDLAIASNGVQVQAVDSTNSLLSITLNNIAPIHMGADPQLNTQSPSLPLLFVIGTTVYGYSDHPLQRSGNTLSAIVPTAMLIANPNILVRALFTDSAYWHGARVTLSQFVVGSQAEQMTLAQQSSDSADFILQGSRLKAATLLNASDLSPAKVPNYEDTMWLIHMTKDQATNYKQLAIQRPGERPTLVQVPATDFKNATQSSLQIKDIAVNDDHAVLTGPTQALAAVVRITFNGQTLQFTTTKDAVSKDITSITILGLKAAGVSLQASTPSLVVSTASDNTVKVTVK